ncbi:MAG: ABC transporter permease [Actinomycetota bacterium]|nr:ABC transporter permease [Actinomycetota bacterium]
MAYYLRSARGAERAYLLLLVLSPLLVSLVIRNFGWVIVLGPNGLLNSLLLGIGLVREPLRLLYTQTAVIIGLVHLWLPFTVLAILTALYNIPDELQRAAKSLGASPIRTFVAVTLPLSIPGIFAGSLIVFSLTVGTFVTPVILGGGRITMMAEAAYDQTFTLFNWQFASAISFVLLAVTTGVVLAAGRFMRVDRFSAVAG